MSVPVSSVARILRKRFGVWLKHTREELGLTQLDIALLLDYAYPTTVSQVERGATALPPGELHRWAEVLRLNPKVLAERYMYYNEPFLFAAIYGKDPHALENLPKPDSAIMRRTTRPIPKSGEPVIDAFPLSGD